MANDVFLSLFKTAREEKFVRVVKKARLLVVERKLSIHVDFKTPWVVRRCFFGIIIDTSKLISSCSAETRRKRECNEKSEWEINNGRRWKVSLSFSSRASPQKHRQARFRFRFGGREKKINTKWDLTVAGITQVAGSDYLFNFHLLRAKIFAPQKGRETRWICCAQTSYGIDFSYLFPYLQASLTMKLIAVTSLFILSAFVVSADQEVGGLVINGEDANIRDHPYMTKVWTLMYPTCGGAILTSRSVLTVRILNLTLQGSREFMRK